MENKKSNDIMLIALIVASSNLSASSFGQFTSRVCAAILSRSQAQRMAVATAAGTTLLAGTESVSAQKDLPVGENGGSCKDTPEYVPLIVIDDETDKQIPVWFDRRFFTPLIGIEVVMSKERVNKSISILSGHHAWWEIFGPIFKRQELALPLIEATLAKYYDCNKEPKMFDHSILHDPARAPLKLCNLRQVSSALQKFAQERYGMDAEKIEFYDEKGDSGVHRGIKLLLLKLSKSAVASPVKDYNETMNTSHALGFSRLWVDSKFREIIHNDRTMKSLGYKSGIIKCTKGPEAVCVARVNGTRFR